MPAADTSCYTIPPEQQSGAGEMNCYKPQTTVNPSHVIVSEIMNEIVDNAFEIVTAKSLQQTPKVEKITPTVVGDILDNILSPSPNKDETVLLDDEIKKIINEMKFPPESTKISTQGVGDQLNTESEVMPDKIPTEPVKRNTLERKTRLTNLVKNSKQMLAKFISDNENDVRRSKSEELHETVIKVIDLDVSSSAENKNLAKQGTSKEPGLLQVPSESTMEMVNLEPNIQKAERRSKEQQDKHEEEEEREIASCSFAKMDDKIHVTMHKKKWNLGTKLLKYFRRRKN